jgi:hypothetical protein
MRDGEDRVIKEIVKRYSGEDAVVRNFGPDPAHLCIHVETNNSR